MDTVLMAAAGLFQPEFYLQHGPVVLAIALGVFSLFFEDIAILIGIAIVQHDMVLMQAVLLGLYAGFITGDMLIYAAGRWLKHAPFIARRMATAKAQAWVVRMRGHMIPMLVICRAIPASRLPTFLAAGILKVPALKYLCISMMTAGIWVTVTVIVGVNIVQMFERSVGFSSVWLLVPLIGLAIVMTLRHMKVKPNAV